MALSEDLILQIKERVSNAYNIEDEVIQKFRKHVKSLSKDLKPIRNYSVNAVSFVSADGGDNRIFFNPAVIELVRVVDSRGNQCALDALPGNLKTDDLNERVKKNSPLLVEPLKKLCDDIGSDVIGLSFLLNKEDNPGKSTGTIRTYRDIIEWAVLYDLLKYKEWGSDTVIIREGLLRTKSFKGKIFPKIEQEIKSALENHKKKFVNVSIVGVAKQSAVLSRLAIALELEGVFHKNYPCYVKVPYEIEEECYNYDKTWLDTYDTLIDGKKGISEEELRYQSMGKLYLVKFGDRPFDPIWPVDIAWWQENEVDKIIGQLTTDAQPGFPIPDFPMSVQKAHDFAKVNGLEMSVIQDIFFEGLTKKLNDTEKEKIFRLKYLGQNLTNVRYKNA